MEGGKQTDKRAQKNFQLVKIFPFYLDYPVLASRQVSRNTPYSR